MEYDQKRLGKNIRVLRKKKLLKPDDFARALGITYSFLGLVERGERGISIENLCKISKFLGVTLDDLICRDFSVPGDPDVNKASGDITKVLVALTCGMTRNELELVVSIILLIKYHSELRHKHFIEIAEPIAK